MAKSTKNARRLPKKGNYKRVTTYNDGGNVSELNYSERREYIEKNYAPLIEDAQMIFSIYNSGIEYDYKADRQEVVKSIIESYKALADYTEATLPQETIYEIQDWDLVRKEIDPDTDEVIGETSLEEVSADNTYNFSYNGLVDLNWRVYYDDLYERYFYVIMPHLGGDIRGNYGDAIILEGNDKEELFYRFYEGFISGGASIYIKFKDGSEIGFDSEQDSDVFYFRVSESFEPTGIAEKYLNDFEKFDTWYGDEFLEETIDVFLMQKGVAPKMMAGGDIYSDTPKAYIEVLGYDEGKWIDLTDYTDGMDVIDNISDWMSELNQQFGGNREEFRVADFEGFGNDLYDEYMGSNEFDEIIEAYEKFKSSDFPVDVISAYRKESGSKNDTLGDVIDEMENNYFGKYDSYKDFGYEMVEQGVYEPSDYDVYITDTDKRILAGEEADYVVGDMDFEDVLKFAKKTNSEYEDEKSELEDKIVELQEEIRDLTALQNDTENDQEYETISDEIEAKEIELEEAEDSYTNIDSRYEDNAREEAKSVFYDEIYDRLENDLSSWLEDNGYTDDLTNVNFISIDYEKIGDEISSDYLIVEFDGELYFFTNYSNGGRISADKKTPQYKFYIVESNTKKIVSGYPSKEDALAQRKLLVEQYPNMRFELFTLGNLKAKTDLDVTSKSDYVELSTLDKIKKVSVDAYRYGKEKVGQANEFLVRNDVKGKIKRGSKKVYDKTKQGFNWVKRQWEEADFGDGKGKAKYFSDGGQVGQEIVFDDSGETNTGVIREITNAGDYIVATDDDRTVLAQRELDVISFGKMRKKVKEVQEEKGFFSFFDEGGDTSKKKDYDVYDNKRMLQNQANEVEHHSEELNAQVKLTKKVPAWVIAKMERATTDLSDITHYLDGENKMSNGGAIGGNDYEIVAFPKSDKFVIATLNPNKNVIRDFSGKPMMFDSINSAQDFIDNLDVKYPYGIPKANVGMILLASELLKAQPQQQPQQPQVVYSVPQPAELTAEEIGITQDIPEMDLGGETFNNKWTNDFCITNLIELANEIQPIKYFVTDRFDADSMESKIYKGKLVIVFKEMASIRVIDAINKFIERAEDCHDIFEQSVNFSSKQKNSISINLLTDDYSDTEFNRGGKVYEFAPKKINLSKTKKIKTNLGDYNLGLITNDFVYFVNLEEGDDNAQTIMYNKNGDLLSDNIFATNDLFETLETEDTFEFIHPELEKYKAEYTQDN